jgi:hypothetical protein
MIVVGAKGAAVRTLEREFKNAGYDRLKYTDIISLLQTL